MAGESEQREFTPLRLVKQAGAAAAAIASVIGLVVLVLSFVRDDTEGTATIAAREQVDLNVSLRDYLEEYRNEQPPPGLTAERLARNGNVFFFDVGLEGYERGDRLVLRWSRFDATIRRRLPEVAFPEQEEELVVRGNRRVAIDVWAPLPANVDAFFVRLEILSEGERAATADSPTQQLLSP